MALPKFNFTIPVLQVIAGSSTRVHRVSPTASVFRAAMDMIKGRINSLVVSDGSAMVGILTERDFLKLAQEKGQSRRSEVSEIMTPASAITTVPSSFTLQRCVDTMRTVKVRHLPVIEKGDVKAVLSMADVSKQIMSGMLQTRSAGGDELAMNGMLQQRREGISSLTIGDLLDDPGINTPNINDIQLTSKASVADAVSRMREANSGSLLVRIPGKFMPYAPQFGIFTERDLVYEVMPFDEESPKDIKLESVARFTAGKSKAMMKAIAENPARAYVHRPATVTCVERKTKVRDCLALMLGNGLLYVPVTENKKPVNIISMRDINHFIAPDDEVL